MSNEDPQVWNKPEVHFLHRTDQLRPLSKPLVMGILNLTPDSYADGGQYSTPDLALQRVEQMIQEGADIIDIGAESTRPGAAPITADQELDRLLPILIRIKANFEITLSVDTYKPQVMRAAIANGVQMINDIYALQTEDTLDVIAKSDVGICLMHMQGTPHSMQADPNYGDVVTEVETFLQQRVNACIKAGIACHRLIIDPGFGFGKTTDHNISLLKNLGRFKEMGLPVLVGLSRKASIGEMLSLPVGERLYGSIGAHVIAVMQGASIIRTHDIKPTVEALKIAAAVIA